MSRQDDSEKNPLLNNEDVDNDSGLDRPESTSIQRANELYSSIGAITACLSPFSEGGLHIAQGYFGVLLSTFFWNMITIAAGISQARYHSRHANVSALSADIESSFKIANWIISVVLLFAMTMPAVILSTIRAITTGFKDHFFSSSIDLAPAVWFAASDFAYGLSTTVNVVFNIYHLVRACQKLSPDNILRTWFLFVFTKHTQEFDFTALHNDRVVKLDKLNSKLTQTDLSKEARDALTKKKERINLQLKNLQPEQLDIINIAFLFESQPSKNDVTRNHADYLYHKQREKLLKHSLTLLGNIFCCCGAVCGGISNFEGGRNFVYPSAVFYVIQAIIKVYQEVQKHSYESNFNSLKDCDPNLFSANEIFRLRKIFSTSPSSQSETTDPLVTHCVAIN